MARVLARSCQITRGFLLRRRDVHLDDVSHGEHPGEKDGVALVRLDPVAGGSDHLGDRAQPAVDAGFAELPRQVKACRP